MNGISTFRLGTEALEYVRAQLQRGGPISSSAKLPAGGEVWAFLPSDAVEFQRMQDFAEGGAFGPDDASEVLKAVAEFIRRFLLNSPSNLLLAEDQFFRMDDPPNLADHHLFTYRGVTYHYRDYEFAEAACEDDLEDAIGSASSYPQIVLLTQTSRKPAARTTIEEAAAQEYVDNVRHIVVGAYDEEGYIVWSDKAKAPAFRA